MKFNNKIIKFSTLVIVLFTLFKTASSQPKTYLNRHTAYAGFTSMGAFYSLNYDRIFSQRKKLFNSYNIGLSVTKNYIALPIGINFFTGKNSHHAEFSFTAVPYIEAYQNVFSGNNLSDKKIYLIPAVGYRYQKPQGGIFFKVNVAPIIYLDPPSDNFWKMNGKIYLGMCGGLGYTF